MLTNNNNNAIINTELRKGTPKGVRYKTMNILLVTILLQALQGVAILLVDGIEFIRDTFHTFYVDHFCETVTEEEYNRMWREYNNR